MDQAFLQQNANLLYFQTQECDNQRSKYAQLKKQMNKLRSALNDKNSLIVKHKDIQKDIKLMKYQWGQSESIRKDQAKQVRDLQLQLAISQKENKKLKKCFDKPTRIQEDQNKEIKSSGLTSMFGKSPP